MLKKNIDERNILNDLLLNEMSVIMDALRDQIQHKPQILHYCSVKAIEMQMRL